MITRLSELFVRTLRDDPADAERVECAACGQVGLVPILDLGPMPRSDGLLPQGGGAEAARVPLRLGFCPACTLVQLLETRPAEEMFKTS